MITLGVNATSDQAFLALADGATVLDVQPYTVRPPQGLEAGEQALALRDAIAKVLRSNSIDRVRILAAESNYSASYVALVPRLTIEAIIAFAAAELVVECERRSRSSVRSAFGLPRSGSLSSHVADVTPQVGGAWNNKRDLAALVALAGNKD